MFTQKNLIIVLLLIIIALVVWMFWQPKQTGQDATVNSTNQTSEPAPEPIGGWNFAQELPTTSWNLSTVTLDKKQVDMNVNIPAPLTLSFDTEKEAYSGFSGCNNFSGTYATSGNYGFTFGLPAATKKACPSIGTLETSITTAMTKVASAGIKGNQLVFTSADGYTELVYDQSK